MLSIASIIVGTLGLGLIGFMGMRDHAKMREKRRDLLDQSAGLLERSSINYCGDGFPSLEGRHLGHSIRAEFIPDTMTIKRLPQLWLSLSRIEPRAENSEFAVLVRPSGTEFYSLTTGYEHRLQPPAGLPAEILARGNRPSAQRHLDRAGSVIGKILSDPKVKEIGVTKKGLRIVWQASEGRRGEHLILRQCVFDDARVTRSDFTRLLEYLDELSVAVTGSAEAPAA